MDNVKIDNINMKFVKFKQTNAAIWHRTSKWWTTFSGNVIKCQISVIWLTGKLEEKFGIHFHIPMNPQN